MDQRKKVDTRVALERLGDTPDKIAVNLYNLGIKGDKSCECNPIALFIRNNYKLWHGAEYRKSGIYFNDVQIMNLDFSRVVIEFIDGFLAGRYNFLERVNSLSSKRSGQLDSLDSYLY
jgi:hypothetical protein